jgi:hypothetical protein
MGMQCKPRFEMPTGADGNAGGNAAPMLIPMPIVISIVILNFMLLQLH